MFEKFVDRPELFIEILRFIPDIEEDLLSLILINKQCHEIIEEKNSIFYQLLCKDRFEMFNNYSQQQERNNETVIGWKEQFLEFVLFSWSECLQTTPQLEEKVILQKPIKEKVTFLSKKLTSLFQKKKLLNTNDTNNDNCTNNDNKQLLTQIKEKGCENIIVKCVYNGCLLISKIITNTPYFRNIRSKYPILKDTTLHYYIKHLKKEIKHHDNNYLLFGVMNEQICNTIVGNQKDYPYLGEITLKDISLYTFNTSYASSGLISGPDKYMHLFNELKQPWNEENNVISIEVKGIKEGNIVIKYYLNDNMIYELKDILKGVDVINCKENRLYFVVNFDQKTTDTFNNTLIIGSTQKLSENNLLHQFNKIQKKLEKIIND